MDISKKNHNNKKNYLYCVLKKPRLQRQRGDEKKSADASRGWGKMVSDNH
jgi:hypothetical protein